jgi:hypothetical protein
MFTAAWMPRLSRISISWWACSYAHARGANVGSSCSCGCSPVIVQGRVPGRAEHQVHRERGNALMAGEGGMQLEREIGLRHHGVHAEEVRARPRVCRLAVDELPVEGDRQVDRGAVGHGLTVAQLGDG